MKTILRNAREAKGLKTRELAQQSGIDQALISKFESGDRKPTKAQIKKLAELLHLEPEPLMVLWLKEKILHVIENEAFGLKALKAAEADLSAEANQKPANELQDLMAELDALKAKLDKAIKG